MADAPKHTEKSNQPPLHPVLSALKIATYPVAALAAYWVGKTEIRKAIYKNFVSAGAFKGLQSTHRSELADVMHAAEGVHLLDGPAVTEASNAAYRLAVKDKFEQAGFHTIADYWRGMHANQKTNALIFAAGAAGIVITTSLAVINNKALLEKLTSKDKENAPTPIH